MKKNKIYNPNWTNVKQTMNAEFEQARVAWIKEKQRLQALGVGKPRITSDKFKVCGYLVK